MATPVSIEVWNPNGKYRVVSTKPLSPFVFFFVWNPVSIDGVIGQLTEDWGEVLFSRLSRAGGRAFSNMAVGYNNVDVNAATKYGVAVGNTPVFLNLIPFYFSRNSEGL
uniref:D-isomer specific 2-hydroxyacid dehydrogenase catalytic domain-containing protein n=1 Tax=Nelumbo nucifera TaxID=4432 RepID=A0A822XLQ1_NELNU|nr:TPA_asm: hypothetical protein HUJ06_021329 [Nelumbo nucifera]